MSPVSPETIVNDAFADNLSECATQLDSNLNTPLAERCATDVTGKHPPRVLFRGPSNPDIIFYNLGSASATITCLQALVANDFSLAQDLVRFDHILVNWYWIVN